MLINLWSLIHRINVSKVNKNNLKIGDINIVKYNSDYYRAKLINFGNQGYFNVSY